MAPQGRADTEDSSWQSDWGNEIQATARSTPCAVNEFKDQGYQYDLSVDIPITRLRNAEDTWVIAGDRAQTVQGCWFKKEDGLAHAKMIRKKDKKVWEQDLNFDDGSWHPSGDPRQENLPATPPIVATTRFDCGKAKTKIEKAICASTTLKTIDDQMATAYQEVKLLSTPDEAKVLVQAQRNWIAQREKACSKKAGPQLAQCIHEENSARRSLLLGRQESGPGTGGRLIPIFLIERGNVRLYELDIQVLRFVDPKGQPFQGANAMK